METTAPPLARLHHMPSRDDLLTWQDDPGRLGVVRAEAADEPLRRSPINDQPNGSGLVFRDPDNTRLELFAFSAA